MQITSFGTWTNSPTSYLQQWQVGSSANGTFTDIPGATSTTYTPSSGDNGKWFRAAVRGVNAGGAATTPLYSAAVQFVVTTTPAVPVIAPSQAFTTSEAASIGATVGTVQASNSPTAFAIVGGNGAGRFSISSSGVITLAGLLDYETTTSYALSVTATNGAGTSATVTVTVNVGDVVETTPSTLPTYPLDSLTGGQIVLSGTKLSASASAPFIVNTSGTVATWPDQFGTAENATASGSGGNSGTASYLASVSELGGIPGVRFPGNAYLNTQTGTVTSSNGDLLIVCNLVRRTPTGGWEVPIGVILDGQSIIYQAGVAAIIRGDQIALRAYNFDGAETTPLTISEGQAATIAIVIRSTGTAQLFVNDTASDILTVQAGGAVSGRLMVGGTVNLSDPYSGGADRASVDITQVYVGSDPADHALVRAVVAREGGLTVAGGAQAAWDARQSGSGGGGADGGTPVSAVEFDASPSAAPSSLPTTFVLENYAATSSPGLARQGMPFVRGDIPAGSVPVVTRSGGAPVVQFDERTYWLDGSLKFAVAHIRDTDFAGSESRTYSITAAPGSFDNGGTKSLSDVTSHDFKVAFSSLTETGDSGTSQVGSGSFTASFNAHSAVATRREKHHSGPVTEGWTLWGMATDNSGGAADAHLKANWHVDVWKKQDGSIHAFEVAAVLGQDWWSVPGKKRRNYTATLKDGATTIETYSNVDHIYRSQWITCQNQGGNSRGKRHWIGGAQPTLNYKPNKGYWRKTKLIPPYDPTFLPDSMGTSGNATYTPCYNQNHRPNIDGTGAYSGRGLNTNPDAIAFMRQTAADAAIMRINAHVGLHVFFHYRSNQNRTRPGETADIANTSLPFRLNTGQGPQIPYDFTADGMPAPGPWFADGRNSVESRNGYEFPQGGDGVWSVTTGDSSHEANYSGFAYLFEGERYHLEATMDLASNGIHQWIDTDQYARPVSLMNEVSGYTAGGPWDAVALRGQQRNGWAQNVIGHAAGLVPATHVASGYFKRFAQQQGRFMKNAIDFMTDDIRAAGLHVHGDLITQGLEQAPWMTAMTAMSVRHFANMTENGYAKLYADHLAKASLRFAEKNLYMCGAYRAYYMRAAKAWHPTDNPFVLDAKQRGFVDISGANNTLTVGSDFTTAPDNTGWGTFKVGDKVYFTYAGDPNTSLFPINNGVPLYVVEVVSPTTCRLSATPGGPAIDFPGDGGAYAFVDTSWPDDYTTTQNPPQMFGADSAAAMHLTVATMANFVGQPEATSSKVAKFVTLLSTQTDKTWATWKMAA